MYIVNPESIAKDREYECNGIVAHYLIYQKHLPLLSQKGKRWIFANTDALKKALKELPFWLNVACHF